MGRRIDLRELVLEDDERDTCVMPDGKEFFIPDLGVKEMSKLLLLEESIESKDTFSSLAESNEKLIKLLRAANPGKKVPDYDLNVSQIMSLIAAFCGAGNVAEAVREALTAAEDGDAPSQEDAMVAARQLAEDASLRAEGEELPLGSAKPSRKRSLRSGTSGSGGRSGGKKRAGSRSKRTSAKRKTSSSA